MPIPLASTVGEQSIGYMSKSIDYIIEDRQPGETASHRLKQIGLMSCMHIMHLNGEAITVTKLCNRISAPREDVVKIIKALEKRGFLTYEPHLHNGGRGRVFVCSLTEQAAAP